MFGQLAGAFHGAEAIPESWLERLAMREFITEMADSLGSFSETNDMNKTFDERWTVEAYEDEGNIVKLQRTADICDAVELAKAMEEEYPKVDIITPKGSVLHRVHSRR